MHFRIILSNLYEKENCLFAVLQLFLAEDSAVDVIVSSVVSADHVFVQQPLHESFRFLQLQDFLMQQCYGLSGMSVPLPRPVVGMFHSGLI